MTQAEPKRLLALVGPEQSGVELLRACLSPSSFWIPDRVTSESGWVEHAPFAFWLIEALRPRTLVELGTHGGFSYFAFCKAVQLLRLGTRCYAVDTFVGDEHAGFYGEEVFTAVRTHNDQHYSAFSTLLRSSFDDALNHFSEGTIDLLHIDGRHFYEDVKHDFELWRSRLSQRSVVLFHDTNERKSGFGVFRLWKELCEVYPHFEFLHGHGLGVLGTGTELVPELHALFAASSNQVSSHLREAYSSLGTAVSLALRNDDLNATVRKQAEELSRVQQEMAETREAAALALGRSNELEQKLAAQSAAVTQLRDELASARNQVGDVTAEVARMSSEFARGRDEFATTLAAAHEQAAAATAELTSTRRDLAMARDELVTEKVLSTKLKSEVVGHAAEVRRIKTDRARIGARAAWLTSALAARDLHLQAFLASTSWRLTHPVRLFGERMPGLARIGRRALDAMSVAGMQPRQGDPTQHALVMEVRGQRSHAPLRSGVLTAPAREPSKHGDQPTPEFAATFDEAFYLAEYPDVAAAITEGEIEFGVAALFAAWAI